MPQTFVLLVPVKSLTLAKSRLDVADPGQRESLMRAFALDAITAAASASRVRQVFVVTDEPGFDVEGADVLPDEGEGDLNRALRHASRRVRLLDPGTAVAALCADTPCLVPHDLDVALAVGLTPRWFVADVSGSGTTLLAAGPGTDLDPHFGPGSAHLHEQSGAAPVRAAVPTLRRDVDTETDLERALQIGVGPHTTSVLDARRPSHGVS